MRVIFAGGGTGGHINPALSIAGYAAEHDENFEALFIGTKRGLETKLVPNAGYDIEYIEVLGFDRKNLLKNFKVIKKLLESKGYEVKDFGSHDTNSVDYPDIALPVCESVLSGECEFGILVCGTGIGMSIAANKVKGIRAAHVTDCYSARMCREHNDAQILCLGERITGVDLALEIVDACIKAEHQGGRHARRVEKIMNLED